jgi:putative tricarboxylic transport membrane protein
MEKMRFPAAPLLLGFVLGPMIEENFRRSMVLSRGDFAIFIERPISLVFVVLTALVLGHTLWRVFRRRARAG